MAAKEMWTCPICHKDFIKPRFNVYKLKFKNSVVHYCSYICYLEGKKKYEMRKERHASENK